MLRRAVQALRGLHVERAGLSGSPASLCLEPSSLDAAARGASHPASSGAIAGSSQASPFSTDAAPELARNSPYKKNPSYVPWTASKDLIKRKTYPKRMRFLLQTLEAEKVQEAQQLKKFPDFRAGDVLEVRMVSGAGAGLHRLGLAAAPPILPCAGAAP